MTDIEDLLAPPYTRLPLVHDETDRLPDATMQAIREDVVAGTELPAFLAAEAADESSPFRAELNSTFAAVRQPSIVLFGDSRTGDCDNLSGLNRHTTPVSWFDYGQGFAVGGPTFDVIRNAGVGGNTTAQMLARMQSDVLSLKPSAMTLWGGTNDGWTTVADVDATVARIVQMLDLALAAGVFVFLISETVGGPTLRPTPFPYLVNYFNDRLRWIAAIRSGVEFWDFNSVIVDPASASGYAKSDLLRDSLHLSPKGASVVGKTVVAPAVARFGSKLAQLVNSRVDTYGITSMSLNAISNPLMSGTDGAVGSGHSGQLPSNWDSSGNVAALSTPARADGAGNDIQVVIAATSTAPVFITQNVPTARLVPGGKYVIEAAQAIDSATSISAVSLYLNVYDTNGTNRFGVGYPVLATAAGDTIATGERIIRSRVFQLPNTAFSGATVGMHIAPASASAAAQVRLGRVSLKRVG